MVDPVKGTYDGMIGCVQRGDTDTMWMFVRSDATPFEPGTFLSLSFVYADPKIYSLRPSMGNTTKVDILYLWNNFDAYSWMYAAIILLVCTILFLHFNFVLEESNHGPFLNQFCSFSWQYFKFTVKIFDLNFPRLVSASVLFFSIGISVLYGYQFVLMNTLSSDLTVATPVRSLESLHDLLYDPVYANVTPVIIRNLNMYNILSSTREGTDERKLFDRIMSNPNQSIVYVENINNPDMSYVLNMITNLISSASQGKSVIIENSWYIRVILKQFLCNTVPGNSSLIHETNEVISPSTSSWLIGKHVPDTKRVLLQYRLHSLSEFGTIAGLIQAMAPNAYQEMMGTPKEHVKSIVCGEKLDKTYFDTLELPWDPFKLTPFRRLIFILLIINIFAFLILILEMILGRNKKTNQVGILK